MANVTINTGTVNGFHSELIRCAVYVQGSDAIAGQFAVTEYLNSAALGIAFFRATGTVALSDDAANKLEIECRSVTVQDDAHFGTATSLGSGADVRLARGAIGYVIGGVVVDGRAVDTDGSRLATAAQAAEIAGDTDTLITGTTVGGFTSPALAAIAAATAGGGSGDTPVTHNTGGADHLAYKDGAAGIEGATVRAYLKSEYDAGTYTLRGRADTDVNGRWVLPMFLFAGNTYTFVFEKPGVCGPDTLEQAV